MSSNDTSPYSWFDKSNKKNAQSEPHELMTLIDSIKADINIIKNDNSIMKDMIDSIGKIVSENAKNVKDIDIKLKINNNASIAIVTSILGKKLEDTNELSDQFEKLSETIQNLIPNQKPKPKTRGK